MAASPYARRIAETIDRERDKLSGIGIRTVMPMLASTRRAVVRSYKHGDDVRKVLRGGMAALPHVVADAMVAGHLQGKLRAVIQAKHAMRRGRMRLGLQDTAVEFLRKRLELSDVDLDRLRRKYGPQAIEAVGGMAESVESAVSDALLEATKQGLPTRDGAKLIAQAFDDAGASMKSPWAAETVFRSQTQLAYAVGRAKANAEPEIDGILWGYEYVTVGDDRVRPEHALMDGTRRPKDDPFWNENTPPCGFNCRCSIIEIFKQDAQADATDLPEPEEVDGEMVTPGADPGWKFNPADLADDMDV